MSGDEMGGIAKANEEVVSDRPRRSSSKGRWFAVALATIAGLAVLGAAGVAYATYDYAEQYRGRILPNARIAGVDVSGMTKREALHAVRAAIRPQLTRRIAVEYGERRWTVSPRSVGAHSDLRAMVRSALAESAETTFFDKMRMRMLGEELSFDREVSITYPRRGVRGFVDKLADRLQLAPRDASIDYSSGWVEFTDARRGRSVLVDKARAALMKALRRNRSTVALPVKTLKPDVTSDAFDQVLLVRIGENRLYLYEDGEIAQSWIVATGQPEYMTPTGLYEITEKRYLPTWINPAPDTWGANMPEEIPPGPNNPLGLRALNWSAPAIRFHGTEATYSLGYNASHGCVRLSNGDAIELYDTVDVGTPIASVIAGTLKPLYVSSPDPTPVPGDEPAETGADENDNR